MLLDVVIYMHKIFRLNKSYEIDCRRATRCEWDEMFEGADVFQSGQPIRFQVSICS